MFWFPINLFYDMRSKSVRKIFHSVSKTFDVPLVDLYTPRKADFFEEEPDLYFAADSIHYSGEGYGYVYGKIKEVIEREGLVKY